MVAQQQVAQQRRAGRLCLCFSNHLALHFIALAEVVADDYEVEGWAAVCSSQVYHFFDDVKKPGHALNVELPCAKSCMERFLAKPTQGQATAAAAVAAWADSRQAMETVLFSALALYMLQDFPTKTTPAPATASGMAAAPAVSLQATKTPRRRRRRRWPAGCGAAAPALWMRLLRRCSGRKTAREAARCKKVWHHNQRPALQQFHWFVWMSNRGGGGDAGMPQRAEES